MSRLPLAYCFFKCVNYKIDIRGYATRSEMRLSRDLKNRLLLLLTFATISYKRCSIINMRLMTDYNVSSIDDVAEQPLNQPLHARVMSVPQLIYVIL